jgi:HAD superfamily hydrolase (TIGR01509 family)
VALRAVFFDVGETLVDETRYWGEHARRLGTTPHVVWAALGAVIEAGGEHHRRVFARLGAEVPEEEVVYGRFDLYPDALPCLEALRAAGYFVGVAGNQSEALERWARAETLPVDWIASSASLGVEKPAPAFFRRLVEAARCEPDEAAYVGDRVDNDVLPARKAGLFAVHVRRGPWGYLQPGAERADLRVASLAELPEALRGV